MRVFVGLDIEDAIRERMAGFVESVKAHAPDVRWVKPESLHITLKFIGEKAPEAVEQIKNRLETVKADSFPVSFRGSGFFPNVKAARVFWLGVESGHALANLAAAVDGAVSALGIPREDREFNPHLTLARSGSGAPGRRKEDKVNRRFAPLQEKLAGLTAPAFGTMSAREFFLFQSQLSRDGSRYTKIARFELNP